MYTYNEIDRVKAMQRMNPSSLLASYSLSFQPNEVNERVTLCCVVFIVIVAFAYFAFISHKSR